MNRQIRKRGDALKPICALNGMERNGAVWDDLNGFRTVSHNRTVVKLSQSVTGREDKDLEWLTGVAHTGPSSCTSERGDGSGPLRGIAGIAGKCS